ncbi:hypothetical protein [Metabacillus malikii]|nr:hypothetical protein [Metabacillus malikii]
MEMIKKDPTEIAYLKKDKKTIEQLEEEEIPKYLEKGELALFLNTAMHNGLEHYYLMFLILSYTGIRVGELVAPKMERYQLRKPYNQHNQNLLQRDK